MITVSTESAPGAVVLAAHDDGVLVAQATVMLEPVAGEIHYRVHRFWLEPSRRGDDAFAGELYPALIAKALELGWATEDDIIGAEVTPKGVKVGRVLINTETDEQRDASLRFRLVGVGVLEEVMAKPEHRGKIVALDEAGYSDDVEAVIAIAELPVEERAELPRNPEPEVVVDPDPPPSPSRPRPLGRQ